MSKNQLLDVLTGEQVIDELTVDDMTVDEMTVDDLTWYPNKFSKPLCSVTIYAICNRFQPGGRMKNTIRNFMPPLL